MLRHLAAGLLAVVFITVGATAPAFASSSGCSDYGQFGAGCPDIRGGVQGDGAVLDGTVTVGGGPGSAGAGSGAGSGTGSGTGTGTGPGSAGSGSGSGAGTVATPPRPCEERFAIYCYEEGRPKPGDPVPGAAATPGVTLSDIAMFRPRVTVQYMQPDGWMVVGLPTNFVAVIERHVVPGTLLGSPADVRFTPVAYRWRYGDGTTVRLGTRGASWQALGLREFDATPTSHVYRASGTYVIELDVEYTAEYRFAGGAWTPLVGVIVLPANDLVATAGEAVTVLVDRDCGVAPLGPGC